MSQKEQYPVGRKVVSLLSFSGFIHEGETYGAMPAGAKGEVAYHAEGDERAAFDFGEYGVHTFDHPEGAVALSDPFDRKLTAAQIEQLKILYHREGYMIFVLLDNCEARELFFNRQHNIWFYVNEAPIIVSVNHFDEPYAFRVDLAETVYGDILVTKEVEGWADNL